MDDTDRHQREDEEAARLLDLWGRVAAELLAARVEPEGGETYHQKSEREQRAQDAEEYLREIDARLAGLHLPVAGIDYDEQPPQLVSPDLPLLPGPPSWRTSLISYYGPEAERAEREQADAIIARAAHDALEAFEANPRAEPPRITAMQIYDHHVARGEPLPDLALEVLCRAMRIDARSVAAHARRAAILRGDEAGRTDAEIAAELGITDRAVRLLRKRPSPPDVALYAAVAAGTGLRALRPAVARTLGLLGGDGRWRRQVSETIRGGIRERDAFLRAARIEAATRVKNVRLGEPVLSAATLASATGEDVRKIQRWMARPAWGDAVRSQAIWLRRRAAQRKPAADQ